MKKDKFDYTYLFLQIIIFGGTICWYLFQWFGPGIIQAYKQNKELEHIYYGGDLSDVNKLIDIRNSKVEDLNKLMAVELKENNPLLLFTNDSSKNIIGLIQPNKNFISDYRNPHSIGTNALQENKEIIENINSFFKDKDSLGYYFFVKSIKNQQLNHHSTNGVTNISSSIGDTTVIETQQNIGQANQNIGMLKPIREVKKEFPFMHLNELEKPNTYKVAHFYYYTDKQKIQLAKIINKKPKNHFSFMSTSKKEKLEALDSLQYDKIILSEEALLTGKIPNSIKAIFAPRNIKDSDLFYFSCFNNKIDSVLFKKKIALFKKMYFIHDTIGNLNQLSIRSL